MAKSKNNRTTAAKKEGVTPVVNRSTVAPVTPTEPVTPPVTDPTPTTPVLETPAPETPAPVTPPIEESDDEEIATTVDVEVTAPFYDMKTQANRGVGDKYKTTEARATELRGRSLIK